ncbi:MAG: TIGR01777 family protein, partial [Flavobacterium sp.]
MRVLITGATGLIGSELSKQLLQNQIEVHYLTTAKQEIKNKPNYTGFYWNPEKGYIDESALIGVDAIVHLAGATISKRWTDAYKQEIIESRIFTANLLFNTLKKNPNQVKQIVSASAIGIYPDSLTEVYTEDSTRQDSGFLGHVVEKWEASIEKFRLLNLRVAKIRTGLVLSEKGGALPEIAKPIEMNLGSAFGSGRQFQSWIHLEDIASIYQFVI